MCVGTSARFFALSWRIEAHILRFTLTRIMFLGVFASSSLPLAIASAILSKMFFVFIGIASSSLWLCLCIHCTSPTWDSAYLCKIPDNTNVPALALPLLYEPPSRTAEVQPHIYLGTELVVHHAYIPALLLGKDCYFYELTIKFSEYCLEFLACK